jgi:hypothetical protein
VGGKCEKFDETGSSDNKEAIEWWRRACRVRTWITKRGSSFLPGIKNSRTSCVENSGASGYAL